MATKLGGTVSGMGSGAAAGTAVLPGWGTAIGAGLGGLVGFFGSNNDEAEAAKAAQQAAFDEIMQLDAPPVTARAILLQKFEQAGLLTPELEQKIKEIDPVQVKETAQNRQMQMEVANKFKERAAGPTAEQLAARMKNELDASGVAHREVEAIRQRAMQEGRSGQGAELAAMIQGAQSGANRAQQGGLDADIAADRAALEALSKYGSLAGDIREQDYRTEAKNTDVQNEFNRFSTTNQIEKEKRRVANENAAREFNVKRQQGVSDANVEQANAESRRQRTAEDTDWNNQAQYRGIRAGAYGRKAGQHQAAQQQSDDELKGVLGSMQQVGTGLGQSGLFKKLASDQSAVKEDDESEGGYNLGSYSKKLPKPRF